MGTVQTAEHTMTRVDVSTGIPFDDFRAAFEKAAPRFDPGPFQEVADSGGTWTDIEAVAAKMAPLHLMIYGAVDASPLLALAGHRTRAVEYLLGNHVIAETMFRHDPHALLYAPLRLMIFSDADGNAVWTMDRPSDAFAHLGNPDITEVGLGLDAKVVALLDAIGVDAATGFRGSSAE